MLIRVVFALGLTQIIGWGSLYYSVAVLAGPMADSLGCSQAWVFGAFSAALALSGLVAPHAGRAIDRHGGRAVLAAGSALAALALALIAAAPSLPLFFIGWLLAGAAMAATLYDAAFPALGQLAGERYRGALTALTLFGGLASTVFWPLAWQLHGAVGWRGALALFAALNLLLCLPLHRWALPRAPGLRHRPTATASTPAPAAATTPRSLRWLAAAFTANAFVFSAIGAHIVATLATATGAAEDAVWIAALIGPMQVTGRILEFLFARKLAAARVGIATLTLTALAMLLLWQAHAATWLPYAFALIYGAANGVMTIVRGAVPQELYGSDNFGHLMGRLARPAFFAKASAPLLIASLLAAGLPHAHMALGLGALSVLALGCYLVALGAHRREGARAHATP